ncbi:MAG TPA: hypothetical protein VGM27_12265 [Acidobacteriaceae bacterium]|jgi:hypothetical protein
MPQIAGDPPSPPVIACFPGLESNNFNGLVLICFFTARATYASASPTVLLAKRAADGIAARGQGLRDNRKKNLGVGLLEIAADD